ncbi:hypothetical protein [Clostridium lacusfryxellense]|uniref:hypothetical protein n=1 Tax=Clostridium lacusfryxellense TaxID=205328 RepID=UPI001C0AF6B2|nr:hypothetical protein [Clostridium lacusfryxellense]MBU3111982.1 hypothetical protein [Clostridium lacusfryxellense]
MSPRIYSEIRVHHKTDEEKTNFKEMATKQASKLGLTVADYIRLIIELDSATGLIEQLKNK